MAAVESASINLDSVEVEEEDTDGDDNGWVDDEPTP